MSRLTKDVNEVFTPGLVNVLNAINIFTTIDFLKTESKVIEKNTSLWFREIIGLKNELIKKYSPKPVNALSYYKYLIKNSAIVSTGIESLDKILDGGFTSGNIYEVSGLPGSGKTLLCLTVMKNYLINLNNQVYYLDSKNNFSAKKFRAMLNNDNNKEQMNHLLVKKLFTKFDLLNSLFDIKRELENGLKCRMIIIDSLAILFMDSKDHADNNNLLCHCVNIMHYLAVTHHLVIIVINLMTLWRESNDFDNYDQMKKKISCGKFWQTIPNIKIGMEKIFENKCKVSRWKSLQNDKSKDVELTITNLGIV